MSTRMAPTAIQIQIGGVASCSVSAGEAAAFDSSGAAVLLTLGRGVEVGELVGDGVALGVAASGRSTRCDGALLGDAGGDAGGAELVGGGTGASGTTGPVAPIA